MIINTDSNKKTLIQILKELSEKHIEDLSWLIDQYTLNTKEERIISFIKNIKNPVKIKNFFYNLNDFEKKVISDILYNLNGVYIPDYILAKYDELPKFERKNILFTNNTYPSYFSLFVYQKKYIPIDIQPLLKTFVPEPNVWTPKSIEISEKVIKLNNNNNILLYTYLYSQLNILNINEKKFRLLEDSKKLLKNSFKSCDVSSIITLLYYADLVKIKNKKIIPKYKEDLDINDLITILRKVLISNSNFIKLIYKKNSSDYIKNIIKFREIVIETIPILDSNSYYSIEEIFKFIEINNYNKLRNINLTSKNKKDDLLKFLESLSFLSLINIYAQENEELIIYINKFQVNSIINNVYSIEKKLDQEIIILENFEIIIINTLTYKNKLIIESFADKDSNKKYLINKTKLLKNLSKGLQINTISRFLEKISTNDLPNSLVSYLNDLKSNEIIIKEKSLTLIADSLIIATLIHNNKFNEFLNKIEENKIIYDKKIEKKLISYLVSLEYYVRSE
jgi:hypothetical protein